MASEVLDLNSTGALSLYVDGADGKPMNIYASSKGGGGALTARKDQLQPRRNASCCIVDDTKLVKVLGQVPAYRSK